MSEVVVVIAIVLGFLKGVRPLFERNSSNLAYLVPLPFLSRNPLVLTLQVLSQNSAVGAKSGSAMVETLMTFRRLTRLLSSLNFIP